MGGGVTENFNDENVTGLFRYCTNQIYYLHKKKVSRIRCYYLTKEGSFPPIGKP